jgi:hypothetical protein
MTGPCLLCGVGALISSTSAQTSAPSPDIPEQQVISIQDTPPWKPWDRGALELDVRNPQKQNKHVEVRFRAERGRAMTSLVVATTDWTTDASEYARKISFPFPSRIAIEDLSWTAAGKIDAVELNVPYFDGMDCTWVALVIKRGQIEERNYYTPSDRCGQ